MVGVAALIDLSEAVKPEFTATLDRAARFDRFLSNLTSSFMDVPSQALDAAIERALPSLARSAGSGSLHGVPGR